MPSVSNEEAKRIVLAAQGFARPRPRKAGAADLKAVIDRPRLVEAGEAVTVAKHWKEKR